MPISERYVRQQLGAIYTYTYIYIYIYIYIYLCNSDCKAHKSREIDSKSQKSLRGSRTVAKMQPPKRIEC